MCELLGLSSNRKTTINLSLTVLAERGENPNMHGDGWGIAFHDGRDVRLIKDAGSAKNSQWVEFIKKQEIHSHDIIAHIRKSTVGKVHYSNTHPFIRELGGRFHSFAHNGTLKKINQDKRFIPNDYYPIGETDSELSFCVLMDRMKVLWDEYESVPPLEMRLQVINEFARDIRSLGPGNFLYSDGEAFFAHGDERHDPITKITAWPGLHYIQIVVKRGDKKFSEDEANALTLEAPNDIVTLFASVPLNDVDSWIPLKRGEVLAVCKGKIISSYTAGEKYRETFYERES